MDLRTQYVYVANFSLAPPKDVELLLADYFELMSKQGKAVRMFQYIYPLITSTRTSLPNASSLLFRCACNATLPVQFSAESMVYSVSAIFVLGSLFVAQWHCKWRVLHRL